jgi:hypothetical protein
VLIICESCIGAIPHSTLLQLYPSYYGLHIIIFLHLLSTNHKCTQPCYFPLLYKPATQTVKLICNSSTRSSRLALLRLLFLWCYGLFHYSFSQESHLSPLRHYLCNKYTLFVTFGYLWTLYVRMCGINDPGHTCDDYLVLLVKSGMIEVVPEPCQP